MDIHKMVFEALDNARINGYDQTRDDPESVAVELLTFDADLEGQTVEALLPYIKAWQCAI